MDHPDADTPEVSVIVPVYNEEERLEQNLDSLLSQQNAPDFEIIYLDDGSTDRSWEKIVELSRKGRNIRRYRLNRRSSIGVVRSLGVQLARGRIIANMDSDCIAPPEWLSKYVLLRDDIGVVGFPVKPPSDLEYLHWRFRYTGTGQYAAGSMPHGCGALIRKDLILQAGSFPDTNLGEDTRLFRGISRMGARILLVENPAIQLLPKRRTFIGHLKRYHAMGHNAGPESRRKYALFLGVLLVISSLVVVFWATLPWASMLLLLTSTGLLTNPRRVRYYVKSFALPRNRTARTICFGAIKMLETLSILSGFVASLRWKRNARVGVHPAILDDL